MYMYGIDETTPIYIYDIIPAEVWWWDNEIHWQDLSIILCLVGVGKLCLHNFENNRYA